jgi:hypothetical protein
MQILFKQRTILVQSCKYKILFLSCIRLLDSSSLEATVVAPYSHTRSSRTKDTKRDKLRFRLFGTFQDDNARFSYLSLGND